MPRLRNINTAFLILCGVWALFTVFRVTSVTDLELHDHNERLAKLPLSIPYLNQDRTYVLQGDLSIRRAYKHQILVSAKDCLREIVIGGHTLYSNYVTSCRWADSADYISFPLPPDLHPGRYPITVRVDLAYKVGYIDILVRDYFGEATLFVFLLAVIWHTVIRKSHLSLTEITLGHFAVIVAITYWESTSPWSRQNDSFPGHAENIELIIKFLKIPGLFDSWETYQPPLYYVLASLWVHGMGIITHLDSYRLMQGFGTLSYVGACWFAIFYSRKFTASANQSILLLLLYIFIPIHFFQAAAINNDAMAALVGMLIFLCAKEATADMRRLRTSLLFGISAALGVMIKNSMLAMAAASLCYFAVCAAKNLGMIRQAIYAIVLAAMPCTLWMGYWILISYAQTGKLLYVNSTLPDSLYVGNSLSRFFSFDLSMLLRPVSFYDSDITQSFPTALYVGAFSGDYSFWYLTEDPFLYARALFFPFIVLGVVGIYISLRQRQLLAPLLFVSHGLFMLLYGIVNPYSCNQNARLWLPVLFAGLFLISVGAEHLSRKGQRTKMLVNSLVIVLLIFLARGYLQLLFII